MSKKDECAKIEQRLFDYIDGELDEKEKTALEAHIDACPECALLLDEYRTMLSELKQSAEGAPKELLPRVMSGVRKEKLRARLRTLRRISVVAASFAVVVGGVLLASRIGLPAPSSDSQSSADEASVCDRSAGADSDYAGEEKEYDAYPASKGSQEQAAEEGAMNASDLSKESQESHNYTVTTSECEYDVTACTVHSASYHAIPDYLIEYVGASRYDEWCGSLGEVPDSVGCTDPCRLLDFIIYFDIPPEVLTEFYCKKGVQDEYDWDLEALCERDAEAWEQYSLVG